MRMLLAVGIFLLRINWNSHSTFLILIILFIYIGLSEFSDYFVKDDIEKNSSDVKSVEGG